MEICRKKMTGMNPAIFLLSKESAAPVSVLTSVKAGIEGVEVLAVQLILRDAQRFTETGRLK